MKLARLGRLGRDLLDGRFLMGDGPWAGEWEIQDLLGLLVLCKRASGQ